MKDVRAVYGLLLLFVFGCNAKRATLDATGPDPLSVEDLAFLTGSWDGTLEYLNYGDDETRVTLPTRAVYSQQEDHVAYRFVYTEPGGEEVDGSGSIRFSGNDRVMFNGASHKLVSHMADAEKGSYKVKITRKGQDNDRDAQIDHIIERNAGSLSITRYILLDGESESFIRHTYTFTRVE